MSSLITRFRGLSDRALDLLAGMTPRDRTLLMGLVAGGGLLVLGGTGWWMAGSLSDLRTRIGERELSLQQVRLSRAEYENAAVEAARIEEQLRANAGTDLSSFLEKAATAAAVKDKLDSVREKSSATEGNIEEKLHSVSLRKLTTEELSKLLFEIETAGYPLRVKTLSVKARKRSDEVTLNVDMDISAFRVLDDSAEEG